MNSAAFVSLGAPSVSFGPFVTPAKAGVRGLMGLCLPLWIPACAGMTAVELGA